MAMIDWVDRRLQNWARWSEGGMSGGLGYASVNLQALGGGGGGGESVIPTNAIEGSETDEEVRKLSKELQATLKAYYHLTTNRVQLSAKLGCAVATVDARMSKAHQALADAFNGRAERVRQVREQMAQAAAAARGGFTH